MAEKMNAAIIEKANPSDGQTHLRGAGDQYLCLQHREAKICPNQRAL